VKQEKTGGSSFNRKGPTENPMQERPTAKKVPPSANGKPGALRQEKRTKSHRGEFTSNYSKIKRLKEPRHAKKQRGVEIKTQEK